MSAVDQAAQVWDSSVTNAGAERAAVDRDDADRYSTPTTLDGYR
ncbi:MULTISPECIES: hypothetical protein [unclassified Nonomuraea]|nr:MULTISPECIES: hypothetical protein [unclassified Nonomuraea]